MNRYQYALQLKFDNINDYACSVNRWLSAPTQVNAFYTPLFNKFGKIVKKIYITSSSFLSEFEEGILNSPFFAAGWPKYVRKTMSSCMY